MGRNRSWYRLDDRASDSTTLQRRRRRDAAIHYIHQVQNILQRFGIQHRHTSPYHPQTNGRLEKFNDIQMRCSLTAPILVPPRVCLRSSCREPTDKEISDLRERRLEHVQDLAQFRQEANVRAESRMEKEAGQRDERYRETGLGIGDLVKRRHEAGTKLHPRWDGPFIVRDVTDKNTYQLQTRNGYVLKNLYNGARLRRYFPSSSSENALWFASSGLRQKDNVARLTQKR